MPSDPYRDELVAAHERIKTLEEELEERLAFAEQRITEGLAPWNIEDLPFNLTQLKYKLEAVEEKIGSGAYNLFERGGSDTFAWHSLYYPLECIGYYDKNVDFIDQVEKLHDRKFKNIWEKRGSWIKEILIEANRISTNEWRKWSGINSETQE